MNPACMPGAGLYARLHEVAQILGRRSQVLARLMELGITELTSTKDFEHTCDVAVLWTYQELGGDVRYPDIFDWLAHGVRFRDGKPPVVATWSPFLRVAHNYLARELQGAHTVYGDFVARQGNKAGERRDPPFGLWKAWEYYEPSARRAARKKYPYEGECIPQEEALLENSTDLLTALESILTEKELFFVTEVYIKDKATREVAQAYAASGVDPRYGNDEAGWKRAEKMIEKVILRARQRARERLGPHWRQLHAEVA